MTDHRLPRSEIETFDYLSRRLRYDADTGELRWTVLFPGRLAGSVNSDGYVKLALERRDFKAHRIAWILHHGSAPPIGAHIDHINGNRTDNRIANLRITDAKGNCENSAKPVSNTSGFKGVAKCAGSPRWRAFICHKRRQIHLGMFDTPEEAHAAYCKAAKNLGWEIHRAA